MHRKWIAALALALFASSAVAGVTTRQTVESGGLTRSYQLHVPSALRKGRAVPLVLVFHGSGADGASMERFSKFSSIADHEGFIVAYPDAVKHEWNDGRQVAGIPSQARHIDDVAFVDAMITKLGAEHQLDPQRIFAAGFSNGGIFAHYLGSQLAGQLATIAPVSGGLAEPVLSHFKPSAPISVCMIHGAADTVVPYNGGAVDVRNNGRIIATSAVASLWTQQDGTFASPMSSLLKDTTPNEHRHVTCTRWPSTKGKAEVVLYTIEDGGHAWPSEPQLSLAQSIWHVSHSFDATKAIWAFFKNHPKA